MTSRISSVLCSRLVAYGFLFEQLPTFSARRITGTLLSSREKKEKKVRGRETTIMSHNRDVHVLDIINCALFSICA